MVSPDLIDARDAREGRERYMPMENLTHSSVYTASKMSLVKDVWKEHFPIVGKNCLPRGNKPHCGSCRKVAICQANQMNLHLDNQPKVVPAANRRMKGHYSRCST